MTAAISRIWESMSIFNEGLYNSNIFVQRIQAIYPPIQKIALNSTKEMIENIHRRRMWLKILGRFDNIVTLSIFKPIIFKSKNPSLSRSPGKHKNK